MAQNNLTCRSSRSPWRDTAFVLTIVAATMVLSIRYAPPFNPLYHDSGIFMYGGWQMTEGALPYVDFWDLKPPGIFVINAVGFALGGRWGVWALESMLFGFGLGVMLAAMRRRMGWFPAAVTGVFILLASRNHAFYQGGNYTEEISASFTMLIMAGAIVWPKRLGWWIGMGVLGGLVFMTKQSCIAIPLALGMLLIGRLIGCKDRRCAMMQLLGYGGAGLVTLFIVCAVMAGFGILRDFYEANFPFIRIYATYMQPTASTAQLVFGSVKAFEQNGLLNLVLFVAIATGLYVAARALSDKLAANSQIAVALLIALPIECVLISVPHRFYGHYFLTLLPIVGLGLGLWCYLVVVVAARLRLDEGFSKRSRWVAVVVLSLMPLLMASGHLELTRHRFLLSETLNPRSRPSAPDAKAFLAAQPKNAPLLMWGSETRWNVLSGRICPSRYMFMVPLLFEDFQWDERFDEFMADLKSAPATIIVDTLVGTPNALTEKDAHTPNPNYWTIPTSRKPMKAEHLDRLRRYVAEHCRMTKRFSNGWVAYLPKNAALNDG